MLKKVFGNMIEQLIKAKNSEDFYVPYVFPMLDKSCDVLFVYIMTIPGNTFKSSPAIVFLIHCL